MMRDSLSEGSVFVGRTGLMLVATIVLAYLAHLI